MRTSLPLALLKSSLLAAMGLSGLAACGGVVRIDDGSGGAGTSGAIGSTGSSGKTGSSSVSTGAAGACAGATPIGNTGFVKCPDGSTDRASAQACDPTVTLLACQGTETFFDCKTDGECTAMPHGHCIHTDPGFTAESGCGCAYACANDSECGQEAVCACSGLTQGLDYSRCVPADCTKGADCASGECGLSTYDDGCFRNVAVSCRSAADQCRILAQCDGLECAPASVGMPYACQTPTCAIGRPLVVEGTARTAPSSERADWIAEVVAPPALAASVREAVARHYVSIAALEHASIGSFARFTLQLLSLGAPAELVADAQRAALDEVEHARLAYAVASAYGGAPVGPSALFEAIAAISGDRHAIVRALVEEGCVGETLGAVEALAIATEASPGIATMHRRIAAEEERHAALAWRTLRWLVSTDAALVPTAKEAFAKARELYARDPVAPLEALPEHGVLGAADLGSIRRRCLSEVIAPCAQALLG